MSDPVPIPFASEPQNTDGVTAEWVPAPRPAIVPAEDAPTATYQPLPTSGPQNSLRQTLINDPLRAKGNPQLPDLPGMTVLEYLDSGGMGHVYLAEQDSPKRAIAVKIATTANRGGLVPRERFDREVRALAAVVHPNIIPIYATGEWHGFPYYTMRYLPGGPLSKQIHRFAGDPRRAVELMRKVAAGLQALHEHGVIHRDMKPHNILLDSDDEPLIADFGLAKWVDGSASDLSMSAAALGTKYYMSPEQSLGRKDDYGPATDIWSFGVVLYELLTGTRPFRDEISPDVMDQVRRYEPVIPGTVPAGLATIITRCLRKLPQDRYSDVAQLAADLDRWLTGAPIAVVPAAVQPRRLRLRPGLAVAGIALCLGLTALVAIVWYEVRSRPGIIAKRLRNGETVTLIGSTGMPEFPTKAIPGTTNQLGLNKDGFAELNSASVAGVELSDEELPWPIRFRAEYEIRTATDEHAHAGIYCSRIADGNRNTLVTFGHLTRKEKGNVGVSRKEFAAFESWDWVGKPRATFRRQEAAERFNVFEPGTVEPREWKSVEIIVHAGKLEGVFMGQSVPPFDYSENSLIRFGTGLGVYCHHAEAIFRNVTLEPYRP